MAPPSSSPSTKTRGLLLACALSLAVLLTTAPLPAHANAPCSLPYQQRGAGANTNKRGCAANGGKGCMYYQNKAYVSHNAPLASFRQPRESLDRLKGFARGVKGHVGKALGGVKNKWASHRAARRAAREEAEKQQSQPQPQATEKKRGGGLFRLGGAPPQACEDDPDAEECAPGQDVQHIHEHAQHHGLPGGHPRYHHYTPAGGHSTPSPLREEDMGPALVVLGRTQAYDAAALLRAEMMQVRPRLPLRRRALTYGSWVVDLMGYGVKLVAVLLFQVLGAALIVNEYNATGLVSRTLLRFSALLGALAFVPPVAVAIRETIPSHARNPFVGAITRVLELALDTISVSAIALLGSMLLTAVAALPGLHDLLLSYQLGEEFIKGALSAGVVMFFLWSFAKQFETLATKWFV